MVLNNLILSTPIVCIVLVIINIFIILHGLKMKHLTNICHLWILATPRERCTCTNTGHLTASRRLSVNVSQVKATTGVCLLIRSRLVTSTNVWQINPIVGTVWKVPNWLVLQCTIIGGFVKYSDTSANEDNSFPESHSLAETWFPVGFYRKSFNSFWMLPTI